jgi:FkbM family methyltransferase
MALFPYDAYDILSLLLGDSAHPGQPYEASERLVALDVGANVGDTARRIASELPNATVHAFEPVPDVFAELTSSTASNPHIRAWPLAVGARSGQANIQVLADRAFSSVLPLTAESAGVYGKRCSTVATIPIPMISLDEWTLQNNIPAAQVLKVDVQGLELEVLRGARRLLSTSICAVNAEAQLVPQYTGASTFSEIDLFLREHGLEIFQFHELWPFGRTSRHICLDALWLRPQLIQKLETLLGDTAEIDRLIRVRKALASLQTRGSRRLAIYGAGRHTRSILPILERSPVPIVGVIDDAPAATNHTVGPFPVLTQAQAIQELKLDAVLLSSDLHEDRLWLNSSPLREAGIEVRRLYAA